jgi:hypothetical protein
MNLGNYGMLIFGTLVVWGCKSDTDLSEVRSDKQSSTESDEEEST